MADYTTIDDPSAHFQAIGWTGNDVDGRALTNDGNSNLQPDLVWIKAEVGYNHFLTDSSRGTSVYLSSNTTTADTTWTDLVESFDTNGFTIGDDGGQVPNHTGNIFAAWQWKANGGTTSSNGDGGITSTVQANTTAGFSIATYTGNSNNPSSVGHGLGVVPKFYVIKQRDDANPWKVYHSGIATDAEDYVMELNTTGAREDNVIWNDTGPTSSVINFTDHGGVNQSGETYIAYSFAEVQGYSKFGKYVGNGSASNGPFVYTGFQPAFIMFKKSSDSGDNWMMYDHKRQGYNETTKAYYPNSTGAESTSTNNSLDILSNGFKLRSSFGAVNQSTHTYIYAAFAKHPFVTSDDGGSIPTTAR